MKVQEHCEPVRVTLEHSCQNIQSINRNNFAIHELDNVRLLTLDFQGSSFYKEKLIFRESSHNLIKILADKNNLYVLSQSGPQFVLKCFNLEANQELTQTGTISSVERINPSFIDEFVKSELVF